MNKEMTIQGKIVASQLGRFGLKSSLYGYATIRKKNGEQVTLKVDSHTECESLAVGDTVEIHAKELGNTGILVAYRVELLPGPFYASPDKKDTGSAA